MSYLITFRTKFTAAMASFTQNEESYTNDSNFYTYNKSTDRISSNNFGHLLVLNKISNGVHSTVRENDFWSASGLLH